MLPSSFFTTMFWCCCSSRTVQLSFHHHSNSVADCQAALWQTEGVQECVLENSSSVHCLPYGRHVYHFQMFPSLKVLLVCCSSPYWVSCAVFESHLGWMSTCNYSTKLSLLLTVELWALRWLCTPFQLWQWMCAGNVDEKYIYLANKDWNEFAYFSFSIQLSHLMNLEELKEKGESLSWTSVIPQTLHEESPSSIDDGQEITEKPLSTQQYRGAVQMTQRNLRLNVEARTFQGSKAPGSRWVMGTEYLGQKR